MPIIQATIPPIQPSPVCPKSGFLYEPADAGRMLGCSGTTVKRTAEDIGIEPLVTVKGKRLFTEAHVERIRAERERRSIETDRKLAGYRF